MSFSLKSTLDIYVTLKYKGDGKGGFLSPEEHTRVFILMDHVNITADQDSLFNWESRPDL